MFAWSHIDQCAAHSFSFWWITKNQRTPRQLPRATGPHCKRWVTNESLLCSCGFIAIYYQTMQRPWSLSGPHTWTWQMCLKRKQNFMAWLNTTSPLCEPNKYIDAQKVGCLQPTTSIQIPAPTLAKNSNPSKRLIFLQLTFLICIIGQTTVSNSNWSQGHAASTGIMLPVVCNNALENNLV